MKKGRTGSAPPNKMSEKINEAIREHVKSFPTVPSHYRHKDSRRHYFEKGLNKTKMWELYCELPNVTNVSITKYKSILSEFNISFHQSKKDDCSHCTQFQNGQKTDEQKEKQRVHLENRQMAREEKERDKVKAAEGIGYVADLEAVSPCPKATSSEFFYVSKINCYNYSIFNLGTKDGTCYRWDETKSGRGCNEMASALRFHLLNRLPNNTKNVDVGMDTCGAQNRNQFLSAICLGVINDKNNNIEEITLKYMEPGHSQSEVDSIQSTDI